VVKLAQFQLVLFSFVYDNKDGNIALPKLNLGEKIVTAWEHDKCTYHGYEKQTTRWNGPDEKAMLNKKGEGQTLMVPSLVSPGHRFLQQNPNSLLVSPENK
jgi:hypothetical protein